MPGLFCWEAALSIVTQLSMWDSSPAGPVTVGKSLHVSIPQAVSLAK